MASSCRFAFAVHVLAVLALKREGGGVCSDLLAGSVNTNPVIIRRLLTRLRHAGLVTTQKGASGGATLAASPEKIPLDAIYRAVESGASFSLHPHQPNQHCPVGAGIERVLDEVFSSAQNALESALASRTLADPLTWQGSAIVAGTLAEGITSLKERHDEVHVVGSLNLVQSLLRFGLVDRLNLWLFPVLLGSGERVFADGTVPTALRLTESVIHANGTLQLTYETAGAPTFGNLAIDE